MTNGKKGFQKGNQLGKLANHKGQKAWNKGLTKINDERIRRMAKEKAGKKKPYMIGNQFGKGNPPNKTSFKKGNPSPKTAFQKGHISWKTDKTAKEDKRIPAGDRHHNWRGGITPKNKLIRHSLKFKEWKNAVFERDNYTCQECYHRGGRLHPHHIKSFSKYPLLRFEVNNGITLCEECHKQVNFKEEDWINYFQNKLAEVI